ncbi:MAG TPA: hypothetical protein IGS52_08070 [Oscillatoriaceae cyanobacterium M33_DOE_052]|uniref:Uncharacterized protein n=1 Tax=Planktothricoides sp. SpSt-374 TaxID=2282167 RepID=A0A7C3VQY6_9CYAN|nr:hypothetical protein [Oscillatoriaceae cyanobacterium M33_DOE_052]
MLEIKSEENQLGFASPTQNDGVRSNQELHLENLQITQKRIEELLEEEEEDDDGMLRPTIAAFEQAVFLVNEAAKIMPSGFGKAWVVSDDKGGITLTWSRETPAAEVRLICHHSNPEKTYIYHEYGDDYAVVDPVDSGTLADWLNWLNRV